MNRPDPTQEPVEGRTLPPDAATGRRYDIDWLRTGAVLLLIPYHTARIFDTGEAYYVQNGVPSSALTLLCLNLLRPWQMPLLFTLAGAATWLALGRRTGQQYLGERVQRLLIPLVFGLLVLVPPQAYLARIGHGGAAGTYLGFLGDYFGHPGGDLTGYTGQITPGSLWFILYLLAFSAFALPLFLFLRGRAGKLWTAAAAGFFSRRGTLWLWALPLALTDVLPGSQGVNPLFYVVLFVYGFLLLSDERYQAALDRQAPAALLLGAATMAAVLAAQRLDPGWPDGSPQAIGLTFLGALNTWLWVCGLLGMGHRALNSTGRLRPLVSEAAYPFYLLHQTVIVAAGYWVVQWPVPIVAKFLSIGLASLAGTVGLYLVAVRPWRIGRWLFGMKRR